MRSLGLGILVISLALASPRESMADEAALRLLDAAYVEGWKQHGTVAQQQAVLTIFADDAVILPGRGMEPRQGIDQLRSFWFPPGSPPTIVSEFSHDITGVDIEGGLGIVRGRYGIKFVYDGVRYARDGNFIFAARRQPDGIWLVTQMIWNDRSLDP